MLGGISDRLIIGFDMSGDDKACLTVARRKGRGYEIVKQFFDGDAEYLYEQLSDVRVISQSRNITDFIDRLISDLEDSIDDYKDSKNRTSNRCDKLAYASRICELNRWVDSLTDLRKEYEEVEKRKNGWIPCSERLPEKPKENPLFDNKPLELYLVSLNSTDYPWRAFWNGKFFTDGFSKVEPIAWQQLPAPYKEVENE